MSRNNSSFKKIALVISYMITVVTIFGQPEEVMNLPGHFANYYRKPGPPNVLNNNNLPAAIVEAMRIQLAKASGIIESCPDFHQPKGFDLCVQFSIDAPSAYDYPLQHSIQGMSWMAIHEFFKDEKGKIEVNPETGSGITLHINKFLRLFPDDFNGECDEFKLPRFFIERNFIISDSKNDYISLKDRRIITNGNPLTVPYTKEQYVQFLLKRHEKLLAGQKKFVQQSKDMKQNALTAPDGHKVSESDKNSEKYGYLWVLYEAADKNIAEANKNVEETEQKIKTLTNKLNNMSSEEKHKQAYMYFNTNAYDKQNDPDKFFELTAENDPHGVALIAPNPNYFNPSLSRTSVQLITILRDTDTRFVAKDYIKIVDRVLDCIDYNALKAMIQK